MEIWKKQGFDTTGLSEVLGQEHRDMEAVDRLFWRVEKMVERVVNMERDLFQMSIPEFEVEIEALRDIMTDPTRLGEVSRKYHHLAERIKSFKKEAQRRRDLIGTVQRFRDMGYKVDGMVPSLEVELKQLEVAVSELEDAVIILQDLEDSLSALDPTGREERIEHVRVLLNDPERLVEAMEEIEIMENSG